MFDWGTIKGWDHLRQALSYWEDQTGNSEGKPAITARDGGGPDGKQGRPNEKTRWDGIPANREDTGAGRVNMARAAHR